MKRFLTIVLLMACRLSGWTQCPVPSFLRTDSLCLGKDTLFLSAIPGGISSITWTVGGSPISTVNSVLSTVYLVVAGGNGRGSALNQFSRPMGICLDPAGNLYVTDGNNCRIMKFPPGSNPLTDGIVVAGGNGLGSALNQLNGPSGIYLDAIGNLYVADTYNSRILEFPPGSTGATPGVVVAGGNGSGAALNQFLPVAVNLDGTGNMFVTDYLNGRIMEFPPGSSSATFGVIVGGGNGQGGSPDQLSQAYSGLLDAGENVYVADQGNMRIQKFPSGSTGATNGLTVAGGNGDGTGTNQLAFPSTLFLDNLGNLYVDDMNNYRILEFPPGSTSTTAGNLVAWGNGFGVAPNQFGSSYGLWVDGFGNIFISDAMNNRVLEYTRRFIIDSIYVPAVNGTYTAIVTDTTGCIATSNAIVVNVPQAPVLNIASSATVICSGDTVGFVATVVNGGASPAYQWQVNGQNTGSGADTLTLANPADESVINCVLTPNLSCTTGPVSSLQNITLTVNPTPSIRFNPDTLVIVPGSSATLSPTVSGTVSGYQWSPSLYLNNAGAAGPVASPPQTTQYQLTVTGTDGCNATGKETVLVYYHILMPNAFTPNGDGVNDIFRIPPTDPQEIRQFSVYNRWGNCIFSTGDANTGWDGTSGGKPQPAGAYAWNITYFNQSTGKWEIALGTVMLMR